MVKKSKVLRNRIGEKYTTNQNQEIEITDYIDANNVTIKFKNNYIVYNLGYSKIIRGQVKTPYYKSVYGIGFLGKGVYKGCKYSKLYDIWNKILQRCYSEKSRYKYKSYKDITVCEEWHNFQNFAKWYEENYNPETMQGWHLDKDILSISCKAYSPKTCCFVPNEINSFFVKREKVECSDKIKFRARIRKNNKEYCLSSFNTQKEAFQKYKTAKEKHIKEVADKWKDQIAEKVYQAMYNYKVEITD